MNSLARLAALGAIALLVGPALAQKFPPDVQDALDRVRKHVESLENGKAVGDFVPQSDPAVKKAFPEQRFVIVRYRIYPVARVIPDGLAPANVFVVAKDGTLERLKDAKVMEAFFRKNLSAVKNEADAKAALAAWLTLSPELHQDNMYKFEPLVGEFAGDAAKVTGRAMVTQGGNGELRADLTFDADGKLTAATEKAAIRRGPRPICQATKLLDPDPIVRRMAEADLLIMGLSARDYLLEQRDRATSDLRDAIDGLWERIQRNGW